MHQTVELLRERERKRTSVRSISDVMGTEARALRRDYRAFGDLGGILDTELPTELTDRVRLAACSRGTLTLACASASTRYALDVWLRSGGEKRIKESTRASLKRIKVVLESKGFSGGSYS